MISALVNLRFRLHDPPHSVVIHGITLNVEQKIEIQVANGAFKRAAQPLNMVVFAWDGGRTPGERTIDDISVGRQDPLQPFHPRQCHLCTLQPGQPKEFNDLAQLPDDQWLRASTIDGIKTPIRVSHTLQVHVYYQAPGNPKDMRQFTMSRPVTIAHVKCGFILSHRPFLILWIL